MPLNSQLISTLKTKKVISDYQYLELITVGIVNNLFKTCPIRPTTLLPQLYWD